MNRQVFSFSGLLVLAAALLLPACVDNNTGFGADFVPSDQNLRAQIQHFDNIPFYTRKVDSVVALSSTDYKAVFGSIHVPPFGHTAAEAVFRIYPYVSGHRFGSNAKFVSASLMLLVSNKNYPDDRQANIVQNIRLYALNRTLSYDATYYNNSITAHDYDATQPISLPGITYRGEDTLIVPLTEAFGSTLLKATDNEMDSLAWFYNRYKGFVLAVDRLPDGITGGRLQTVDVSEALLALHYQENDTDTVMYYYGDYGLVLSACRHASAHLEKPDTPEPLVYYEGMAGVKPVFDMAAVTGMVGAYFEGQNISLENVLINKAELVVPVDYPAFALDKYPANLGLAYRQVNSAGKLTYVLVSDAAATTFGGVLNRSLLSYSFNISQYLQQVLKPGSSESAADLYLLPTATMQDAYGYSYTVLNNTTYAYGALHGMGGEKNVRLKLTYTCLH